MDQKGILSPNPHGGEHRPWRSELTYNPDANNGNISGQTISGTHGLNAFAYSQTYTYDNLNRLETVLDSGVGVAVDGRSQIFVYDRYGNRALKQNSFKQNGAVEVPTPTAVAVEAVFPGNRLNNCCNAAGDATALNGKTIAYDGEHRVTSVAYTDVSSVNILLEYFYDADGRRIRATKKSNGTLTSSTVFVYDSAGQLMAEYTTPSPASEGRQYLTQDHLGSTRLVTKATGTDLVFSRHDFMPFGEELARGANGYGPSALAMKFTGKERDAESGLDYFGARYMSAAQGRFTSPDPLYIEAKRLLDPQSLNLYAYVRNNPLKFVDPDGMDFVLNCNGSQENCQQTVNDINNRKGGQFKVEIGKNNKLQVVKGSVAKNLSGNESALLGAVNDTNTTATINVLGKDSSFNFEKYDSNGQNSIDRADLNVLGGANKELPGEIISHAMMESYSSAQNESGYLPAHQFANRFYGRILIDTDSVYPIPSGAAMVTGIDTAYRFSRNGMDASVIRTFDTPIPLATLRQRRTPPPGQVTGVTVTPIR